MKRIGCLLVGLLVLGAVALATPKLAASPELYDFGVAMDGAVVQYTVTLTNSGTSTLTISNVSYNCSCTSYSLPKRTIAPGETVMMTVTFRTAGYSRYAQPVSQTLTISSNDPTRPQLPVTVRGVVRTLAAHEGAPGTLDAEFYVLVDLRTAAEYAQGHLLGAVNIPYADLSARLGELPKSKVVYLYDTTGIQAAQAVQLLQQNAFLLPRAISGGLVAWWQSLGDLFVAWAPDAAHVPPSGTPYYGTWGSVQASRVAQNYLYIVDLRSPETFAQGHFPGAVNVSLPTQDALVAWAAGLPRPATGTSLSIWVVDDDGSQSCAVAQYLQSVGFAKARCLFGGIAAWRASFGDELLFPSP
ncbi:MAG: hypothetical protein BIP78_0736 [Candidatus Bipolaricaulis sibiricus]|uniref:Rhodanese domain-containing protein n=1 Tax=Bipolaricaulis sibiricus TaxID=2501609 RepID=A0A410FU36_BIPS1|nr:MAG: hypothetical protein BIP78_0736 [Candidatus Bipolaricaulis sibiricus]